MDNGQWTIDDGIWFCSSIRPIPLSRPKAARLGGDEFVVMIANAIDPTILADLAARLIAHLEAPITVEGGVARISASVGIAISTDFAQDARAMLQAADEALYNAKAAGRAGFAFAASPQLGVASPVAIASSG